MKINGEAYRTIWFDKTKECVSVINQTILPHEFQTVDLFSSAEAAAAIKNMIVRGAPLIGVTGAYGMALASKEDPSDSALRAAYDLLHQTRPTAVNLRWALSRMLKLLLETAAPEREARAISEAAKIAEEDAARCELIGEFGGQIISRLAQKNPAKPLNILTHCNAGWLCAVDWGTALAPIYKAARAGVQLHVWVDETRPRNQGASLTAFELLSENIPHTVIADNTGGHLMQHGQVDMCIVGSDRTTYTGDVCNKIGTYLKALAAHDNNIPFFVALPSSTIDWRIRNGITDIPIEERDAREVTHISGMSSNGTLAEVQLTPNGSAALNYGFDVTPSRLISGLITERGLCKAEEDAIRSLFPDYVEKLYETTH